MKKKPVFMHEFKFLLTLFFIVCSCFSLIQCHKKNILPAKELLPDNGRKGDSRVTESAGGALKAEQEFPIESIISPGPVFSVSVYKDNVIWCAAGANRNLAQNIYRKKSGEKNTELVYSVHGDNQEKSQVMPARLYENRIAWVEYFQAENMDILWELCTMETGNPRSRKSVASNKHNHKIQFPGFDLEKDLLVFDMLLPDGKDQHDSPLYAYTISADLSELLLRMPGYDLCAPDIRGDEIIFCRLSVSETGRTVSEPAIYNRVNRGLSHLQISKGCYEPALSKDYLVFKEAASLYAYGHIKLYNRNTHTLDTLSSADPGGELPFIGARYAVWESPFFDKIEGYDLQENKKILFEKGNTGKPFLLDNSLVWVAEPVPGEVVIRYLNLAGS